jgi:uncharacterized membrane-anchored protein
MQQRHLPTLGARYWTALCLASVFGANMGDFFARNLGLGHVYGLPFLALALAIVTISERFDRSVHQVYYWTAIIIVRTAATNVADRAGPGCLNRFSASISGASAGVRLPSGRAAR